MVLISACSYGGTQASRTVSNTITVMFTTLLYLEGTSILPLMSYRFIGQNAKI